MANKNSRVTLPTNFVGTVYDHNTKVYVAARKDGSLTFGRFNEKGTNVAVTKPESPRK